MTRGDLPKNLPRIACQAVLRPGGFDAKSGTVDVIWSTGTRVRHFDWELGEFDLTLGLDSENVDLSFAKQGAPVLAVHDAGSLDAVVGVIESINVDGKQGTARLRLSSRPEVAGIRQDIADGVLRFVSVGTRLVRLVDITEEGDPVRHFFAEKHEPLEISLTPIPRDRGAAIQSETGGERFPVEIVTRKEGHNMPEIIEKNQKDQPDVVALECARCLEITKLVKLARLPAVLAEALIRSGATADRASRKILDELATQGDDLGIRPQISIITDERDHAGTFVAAATEALGAVGSSAPISRAAQEFAGWPPLRLAEECIRRSGARLKGFGSDQIVRQALHTTSDFPEILSGAANRFVLSGFEGAQSPLLQLSRERVVDDFKEIGVIRVGEHPDLLLVREGGEFTRGTVGEAAEKYRLATYGRVVGLSRQAIVNDSLNAFGTILRAAGAAAAELQKKLLATTVTSNPNMADGQPVFHSSHGNVAGSGGALSVATLSAARLAMRKQKGIDGVTPIEVIPSHLVVPAALETVAEQLLVNLAAVQVEEVNPFPGRLSLIVDARLDAASATAWYLASASTPGIEHAYLAGQTGPFLEQRVGFDVDGIEFKVRLDFATAWIDHRSWHRNPGA